MSKSSFNPDGSLRQRRRPAFQAVFPALRPSSVTKRQHWSPFISSSSSLSRPSFLQRSSSALTRPRFDNTYLPLPTQRIYAVSSTDTDQGQRRTDQATPTPIPSSDQTHNSNAAQEQQQDCKYANDDDGNTARMFSNLVKAPDGSLKRQQPSELACTALVAGTMIGAGVLALPTVAAPSGLIPSTTTLLAVWAYMSITGLLISEVTINTACALGRADGVSMLSLGRLTLGRIGGIVTAGVYVLLHYAILTAYTAQGGQILDHSLPLLDALVHALSTGDSHTGLGLASVLPGALFASIIGLPMLLLSAQSVARANNAAVGAAIAAFFAVVLSHASSLVATSGGEAAASGAKALAASHWDAIGVMVPVAFVSCVYHNIVTSVTMRLEGDRAKIRRAIIFGSGLPVAMFVLYDAVMLAAGSASDGGGGGGASATAVALFSALAIATSFVGFVEGLTEMFADVRQTVGNGWQNTGRVPDFVATLVPPIALAASSPDVFFKALDVAGTYGIAVLFGLLPAAMAWRNRSSEATRGFKKIVGGGNAVLAGIASVPVALIASRVWEILHHHA